MSALVAIEIEKWPQYFKVYGAFIPQFIFSGGILKREKKYLFHHLVGLVTK